MFSSSSGEDLIQVSSSSSGEDLIQVSSSSSGEDLIQISSSSSDQEEFIYLLEFGKDIMALIFKELQYGEIVRLCSTCKEFLKSLKIYQKLFKYRLTKKLRLKTQQFVLRHQFLATEECFSFRAEMGYGKTIAGYACCTKVSLIVCTGNTMKVWVDEAKKIGWYNSNPKNSRIVCFSSNFKNHNEYLKTFVDRGRKRKRIIIVTFQKNILTVVEILVHIGIIATLIVDEAHIRREIVSNLQCLCKWNSSNIHMFNRELLLSSCAIIPLEIKFEDEWIHRKIKTFHKEIVPTITWKINLMKPPEVPTNYNEYTTAFVEIIEKIVKRNNKTVIVVDAFFSIIKYVCRKLKVFWLEHNSTAVSKFNQYKGKACLVLCANKAQELDVHADAILIFFPSNINVSKCKQNLNIIGKSCNPIKRISVYFIDQEKNTLNCSYLRYFLYEHWIWNYEDMPVQEYLSKSNVIVKMLGSTHDVISQTDGCIIFHNYIKIPINPDTLVSWWNKHKTPTTILTEALVRSLC